MKLLSRIFEPRRARRYGDQREGLLRSFVLQSVRILFFKQRFQILPPIYRGSCPRAAWIKRGTSVVNKIRLTTFLPSSRCYAETGRHLIPRQNSGQDPRCARAGFSFRSASTIRSCRTEQSVSKHLWLRLRCSRTSVVNEIRLWLCCSRFWVVNRRFWARLDWCFSIYSMIGKANELLIRRGSVFGFTLFASCNLWAEAQSEIDASAFENQIRPFLEEYCIQCHGADKQKGERRFDSLEYPITDDNGLIDFQDILDLLNLGDMPPEDEMQPSSQERQASVDWLTRAVSLAYESRTIYRSNKYPEVTSISPTLS